MEAKNSGQKAAVRTEFRPATELLDLLRTKRISSVDLLKLYLARIEKFNPRFNAVVAQDVEGAIRAARMADEARARGKTTGPLHGLPITIKDSFEVAGMTATCGIPTLANHRPERDADAVARLRDAGAIIFAKTNLPEGATDHQSYNPLFGVTRNPWNLDRTVGGSSGGAAAAIAAGLTALELGSDIGGSIRCPCHFCGVYGHKPSYGVIALRGHVPPPPGALLEMEMAVVGPLARSARDLELALDIMAAPGTLEETAWSVKIPASRHNDLRDFRVALWADASAYPVDSACVSAMNEYADDLRRLGVKVNANARPEINTQQSYDIYLAALVGILSAGAPPELLEAFVAAGQGLTRNDRSYPGRIARAVMPSFRQWAELSERREHLFRQWRQFFTDFDVLLCPIMPTVAFPHDTKGSTLVDQYTRTIIVDGKPRPYLDNLCWPGLITVANLPATAVPTGRLVDGLPVGLQVVGPYLEDRTPLRFAQLVEEQMGGFVPPPAALE